jgi:septum formation inhibitor-activating ATPase MinD
VLASHNGAAVSYLNIARRLLGEHVELAKMKQWKVE